MTKENFEEQPSPLTVSVAHTTDVGLCREENQDSFGIIQSNNFRCYVVADGMGGANGGAIASSLAIEVFKRTLEGHAHLSKELLARAVETANRTIFERGLNDNNLTGMGTTLVAIAIQGEEIFVVNVGDSRAYRFHGGVIHQITRDHTLVGELLRSGAINPDQAANHPVSHMLTRSLGPVPEVEPDIVVLDAKESLGDIFLLCSDGLYNMVHPEEFVEVLQSLPLDDVPDELVSLANLRGGVDNITVIAVRLSENSVANSDEVSSDHKQDFILIGEESSNKKLHHESSNVVNEPPPEEKKKVVMTEEEYEKEVARRKKVALTQELYRYLSVAFIAAVITSFVFWGIYSYSALPSNNQQLADNITAPVSEDLGSENQKETVVEAESESFDSIKSDTVPGDPEGTLSASQLAQLELRRGEINQRLARLRSLLSAFDQPMTGDLAESFQMSSERIIEVDRESKVVEVSLSDASRKLTQWLGYKRRLDTSDTLSLAGDISKVSPVVKEAQESFRATTYEYLKAYEGHSANRLDLSLEAQVAALSKRRSSDLRSLDNKMRSVIKDEIEAIDRVVGDLTFRRDELARLKSFLELEVSAIRAIMSDNRESQLDARQVIQRIISEQEGELLQISSLF